MPANRHLENPTMADLVHALEYLQAESLGQLTCGNVPEAQTMLANGLALASKAVSALSSTRPEHQATNHPLAFPSLVALDLEEVLAQDEDDELNTESFSKNKSSASSPLFEMYRVLYDLPTWEDAQVELGVAARLHQVHVHMAVAAYNLAVTYHQEGMRTMHVQFFSQARSYYHMALKLVKILSSSSSSTHDATTMELAIYNNMGNIYAVFNDSVGIVAARDMLERRLRESHLQQQASNSVMMVDDATSPLDFFAQSLAKSQSFVLTTAPVA